MAFSNFVSTRVVLLMLVAFAADGASNSAWNKLQLKAQKLSVVMPGTAKTKEIHSSSFIGDITTHEYYVNAGLDAYSVEITDLPGFAVTFSGSDTIYDHAKGALLKKTLSKPISFTDISLSGVQGKKLVYDTPTKPGRPEMQGEARFFLFGHRLYIADAVVEMDGGDEKFGHFFSSLDIKQ
jgi:hypothetical protein